MQVKKLNGNYQGYPDWKWALQFGQTHKEKKHERAERMRYAALFRRLYGPWLELMRTHCIRLLPEQFTISPDS
jgi:hypothetical protein